MVARLRPTAGRVSDARLSGGDTLFEGSRRGRLRAVSGLGEQQLHILDAPLAKAALAVGQVELPQTPEALVIAELIEPTGRCHEAPAPVRERLGVVRGDVLQVDLAQVRVV